MMAMSGSLQEETSHYQTFNQKPELVVIAMTELPLGTNDSDESEASKKEKSQNLKYFVKCASCSMAWDVMSHTTNR